MNTYAAAIGVAGLPSFAELNVKTIRSVFGEDISVVIRDDRSTDSPIIEKIAAENDCYYASADVPLGHFSGDMQATIDALALAEQTKANIAIKMSQRCILKSHQIKELVDGWFENPDVMAVIPGRPNPNKIRQGHQQYARFAVLTDMVFMRAGAITADMLKAEYENQVKNGSKYHDCFVEVFWDRLRTHRFPGQIMLAKELTDHVGGQPHLYLRRYQNTEEDYTTLAESFGIICKRWDLRERAQIMRRYNPRPNI